MCSLCQGPLGKRFETGKAAGGSSPHCGHPGQSRNRYLNRRCSFNKTPRSKNGFRKNTGARCSSHCRILVAEARQREAAGRLLCSLRGWLFRRSRRLRCAVFRGIIMRCVTSPPAPSLAIHFASRCWRCHDPGGDHDASECENYEQGDSSHDRHLLLPLKARSWDSLFHINFVREPSSMSTQFETSRRRARMQCPGGVSFRD